MGGRGTSRAGRQAVASTTYKEFSDVGTGRMAFAGTGAEQKKFFNDNSNFEEVVKGMSDEEGAAIRSWASGFFMGGQQYKGWDRMDRTSRAKTALLDDLCDRSTLSKGFVAVREGGASLLEGIGLGHRITSDARIKKALNNAKGAIITSKTHLSSSAAKTGLEIGDIRKFTYRFHIPPNTGSGMWIGDMRLHGWGVQQREYLINRDTSWKIGGYKYDKVTGKYTVDLMYVGRQKHDYGNYGRNFGTTGLK